MFTSFKEWQVKSLAGEELSHEEARAVLNTPDDQLMDLLMAAYAVRKTYFGNRVKLCVLQNARSGLCPEDCHYCSQSIISKADIDRYPLLSKDKLIEGARRAVAAKSNRYCMVTSGRGPTANDIDRFCNIVQAIKTEYPALEICLCLGILSEEQARKLKASGVGWINHNLNTSKQYYSKICTTHTYEDRVRTVENVRKAGLSTCCGGIIGMGETDEDVIELAFSTRTLKVDSIPVNFLHPIEGTPLKDVKSVSPERGLKTLCLFRFLNPESEIRAAGGRELNLKDKQGLALYPANSIFINGYLTTSGQAAEEAQHMIHDMGFEVEEKNEVIARGEI